jgi:hypothetical protein
MIEVDTDLQKLAAFMQAKFPAAKLVSLAEALLPIAHLL